MKEPVASRALAIGLPLVVGLAVLVLWQVLVTWMDVPRYLVPSPLLIAQTLVEDWPLLGASLRATLTITVLALAAATLLGTAIAFLFAQSRLLEAALFPYAVLAQVTPLVAIAPLLIIWIQDVTTALVVCATLVALFPIIGNTTLGLRSASPQLLDLFRMNRATRLQVLLRLRVPSAAPYFFGGLRISSGLALIGAVVAEFVAGTGGTSAGLAYQILQAGFQLNTPRMFAALVLIAAAGVALFVLSGLLAKWVLGDWHESELRPED